MARIVLIGSNPEETAGKAKALRSPGRRLEEESIDPGRLKAFRDSPPDVFVLDLDRAPSGIREFGVALRIDKATRRIPLVFAGGEPEKVEAVRRLLPDASFTAWTAVRAAVQRALIRPPAEPVVPGSRLEAYAATPLTRKLGIRPGMAVGLLGAPKSFEAILGSLPRGARLRRGARGACDLLLWFVGSAGALARDAGRMASRTGKAGLWILWPKKASRRSSDLTQAIVRRAGLDAGLVDYKVCRVDDTWAGLKFAKRKPRR